MERKIGIGSSSNPLINLTFLLILITYLVDTVLIRILSGKILSRSFARVKGIEDPYSKNSSGNEARD